MPEVCTDQGKELTRLEARNPTLAAVVKGLSTEGMANLERVLGQISRRVGSLGLISDTAKGIEAIEMASRASEEKRQEDLLAGVALSNAIV